MRLGIPGDMHGYLPGSDTRCIDFAVHLTATLAVDELYGLDTASWTLERLPSWSLA